MAEQLGGKQSLTMTEAGQRVQPNVGRTTVSSLTQLFRIVRK